MLISDIFLALAGSCIFHVKLHKSPSNMRVSKGSFPWQTSQRAVSSKCTSPAYRCQPTVAVLLVVVLAATSQPRDARGAERQQLGEVVIHGSSSGVETHLNHLLRQPGTWTSTCIPAPQSDIRFRSSTIVL